MVQNMFAGAHAFRKRSGFGGVHLRDHIVKPDRYRHIITQVGRFNIQIIIADHACQNPFISHFLIADAIVVGLNAYAHTHKFIQRLLGKITGFNELHAFRDPAVVKVNEGITFSVNKQFSPVGITPNSGFFCKVDLVGRASFHIDDTPYLVVLPLHAFRT